MDEQIRIFAEGFSLVVTPVGGGVLNFTVRVGGRSFDILQASEGNLADPLDRALIPMAPWCNRVSNGGFWFDGRFRALLPNLSPFPFPLHGNAFQSLWAVDEVRRDTVTFSLLSNGPGDFSYAARLHYRLGADGLTTRLQVQNLGDERLPFGIGLHPWLSMFSESLLQFQSTYFVATDALGLPSQMLVTVDHVDFNMPRALPKDRLDNTYVGWDGVAQIVHGTGTVHLATAGHAPYLHIFSPSRQTRFCCVEPQSSLADQINRPLEPPFILEPGAESSVEMTIGFRPRI